MTTFPTELITEILSFIPPKSLCRFKSVAKSWHILITSDAFIKLHLAKTLISQPPNLIICHVSDSPAAKSAANPNEFISSAVISAANPNELIFSAVDNPVKHLPEFDVAQFIGSCRGILCISDDSKKTAFYFNPSTKTHRLIPPAPTKFPASDHLIPYVCQPPIHAVIFGFGYDSSVDDYKLLRIIECYVDHALICREVRLYSLRSNSWKNVYDNFDNYHSQEGNAVHVDGVLYFLVAGEYHVPLIKGFDLKTEEFSAFDLFAYDKSFDYCKYALVELGGSFAVMANYLNEDPSMQFGCKLACADLWVRKEVSWVRLFRVSSPFKIGSLTYMKPVVYSKDGGRVFLEVDGSKFYWFDWCSNEFTRVETFGILSKDLSFDSYPFVPSIVSLRSDEVKAKDECKDKDVPKKNVNKKNLDGFLSTGFKLRL